MSLFPFIYKINMAELVLGEFFLNGPLSWLMVDEAWADLKIQYIEQTGTLDGWDQIDESDDYETEITIEAGSKGDLAESYFIVTISEREKTDELSRT